MTTLDRRVTSQESCREFSLSISTELLEDAANITRSSGDNDSIEYIRSGEGYIEADGFSSRVKAGDCFCMRRGTEYRFRPDAEGSLKSLRISAGGTLTEGWLNLYGITFTPYIKKLDISREWYALRELSAQPDTDETRTALMLSVHDIIFRLSRAGVEYYTLGKPEGSAYRDRRKLMLDVKKYIEKTASESEGVSLDELTEVFGISKSQLIKLFKKQYGLTPYAYASELRLRTARTLLEASEMSIDEITSRLGYFDRNHFTKAFIAVYGCTPSAYRRNKEQ